MKLQFIISLSLFLTCCHGFVGNLGFQEMMRRPPTMLNLVRNSFGSTGEGFEGFEKPGLDEIKEASWSWYQKFFGLDNKFLKNIKNENDLIPLLKDKLRF